MVHTLHKKWQTGKKMDSLMPASSVEKLDPGVTFTAQNELILSCTHEEYYIFGSLNLESAFQTEFVHSAAVVRSACTYNF